MTALRERVHNDIDLVPEENMQQLHDIIITFVNPENNSIKKHAAKGSLKEYADTSKWDEEEKAFEKAVIEKYGLN